MKLVSPGWMDSSLLSPILRFVPDIGASDAGPLWRPFDRIATLAIHLARGAVEHRQHRTQSYRRPGSDLWRACQGRNQMGSFGILMIMPREGVDEVDRVWRVHTSPA